jgi:hypothetical protein
VAIELMVLDQQQVQSGQWRIAHGHVLGVHAGASRAHRQAQDEATAAPSTLCTVRSPPIARASSRAMESPSPLPPRRWPLLPCWKGWNRALPAPARCRCRCRSPPAAARGRAGGISCRRSSMPPNR